MTRREAGELVGANGPAVSRWAAGQVPHARGPKSRMRAGTQCKEEPMNDSETAAYESAMTENMLFRAVLDDLRGLAPGFNVEREKDRARRKVAHGSRSGRPSRPRTAPAATGASTPSSPTAAQGSRRSGRGT